MKCSRFETLIALYVEGDLSEIKSRQVIRHLGECSACREFATALAESQSALKGLASESLDSESFRTVRQGVMSQISQREEIGSQGRWISIWKAWQWKAALAAATVFAISLSLLRHGQLEKTGPPLVLPVEVKTSTPALHGSHAELLSKTPTFPPLKKSRSLSSKAVAGIEKDDFESLHLNQGPIAPPEESSDTPHEIALGESVETEPFVTEQTAPQRPSLVVKLLTDDPNIVIYWLIDEPTGEKK